MNSVHVHRGLTILSTSPYVWTVVLRYLNGEFTTYHDSFEKAFKFASQCIAEDNLEDYWDAQSVKEDLAGAQ